MAAVPRLSIPSLQGGGPLSGAATARPPVERRPSSAAPGSERPGAATRRITVGTPPSFPFRPQIIAANERVARSMAALQHAKVALVDPDAPTTEAQLAAADRRAAAFAALENDFWSTATAAGKEKVGDADGPGAVAPGGQSSKTNSKGGRRPSTARAGGAGGGGAKTARKLTAPRPTRQILPKNMSILQPFLAAKDKSAMSEGDIRKEEERHREFVRAERLAHKKTVAQHGDRIKMNIESAADPVTHPNPRPARAAKRAAAAAHRSDVEGRQYVLSVQSAVWREGVLHAEEDERESREKAAKQLRATTQTATRHREWLTAMAHASTLEGLRMKARMARDTQEREVTRVKVVSGWQASGKSVQREVRTVKGIASELAHGRVTRFIAFWVRPWLYRRWRNRAVSIIRKVLWLNKTPSLGETLRKKLNEHIIIPQRMVLKRVAQVVAQQALLEAQFKRYEWSQCFQRLYYALNPALKAKPTHGRGGGGGGGGGAGGGKAGGGGKGGKAGDKDGGDADKAAAAAKEAAAKEAECTLKLPAAECRVLERFIMPSARHCISVILKRHTRAYLQGLRDWKAEMASFPKDKADEIRRQGLPPSAQRQLPLYMTVEEIRSVSADAVALYTMGQAIKVGDALRVREYITSGDFHNVNAIVFTHPAAKGSGSPPSEYTALTLSAISGKSDCVKVLLDLGANVHGEPGTVNPSEALEFLLEEKVEQKKQQEAVPSHKKKHGHGHGHQHHTGHKKGSHGHHHGKAHHHAMGNHPPGHAECAHSQAREHERCAGFLSDHLAKLLISEREQKVLLAAQQGMRRATVDGV